MLQHGGGDVSVEDGMERYAQMIVENKELFASILQDVIAEIFDEKSDVCRAAILVCSGDAQREAAFIGKEHLKTTSIRHLLARLTHSA